MASQGKDMKPEYEPIRIRPRSNNWALVILSFLLALVMWALLAAPVLWEGAG
jgi:hypothetical protein